MLFRNSGERTSGTCYRVDGYEAYQAWVLRRNEYDECKRGGQKSYCADPGPLPQ